MQPLYWEKNVWAKQKKKKPSNPPFIPGVYCTWRQRGHVFGCLGVYFLLPLHDRFRLLCVLRSHWANLKKCATVPATRLHGAKEGKKWQIYVALWKHRMQCDACLHYGGVWGVPCNRREGGDRPMQEGFRHCWSRRTYFGRTTLFSAVLFFLR